MRFSTMDDNGKWHEVYEADDLSKMLHDTINYYRDIARREKNRGDTTLEEAKKQVENKYAEENKRMEKQLSLAYLIFNSEKEQNAFKEFEQKHKSCRTTNRINSGKMPYIIPYGTGFGTAYTVICPVCGEKQDITDYNAF